MSPARAFSWRRSVVCVVAAAFAWLAVPSDAEAADGGASLYVPGAGFYVRNDLFFMSQSADTALLQGRVNTATDYHTGSELHLDFIAAQYFSESFAVGLNGYWYRQMGADSGSGATLGAFRGEAVGLGPAFFWSPRIMGARINVIGKWLHDVTSTNRFHGDIAVVSLAFKFSARAAGAAPKTRSPTAGALSVPACVAYPCYAPPRGARGGGKNERARAANAMKRKRSGPGCRSKAF